MCVSKTTWKDDIKKINKKQILTFQTRDPSYYTESTIHEKKIMKLNIQEMKH